MVLTNSQYEQLMAIYYQRQTRAHRIEEERAAEIRKKIPEFAELDQKVSSLSLDYAKSRLLRLNPSPKESSNAEVQTSPDGKIHEISQKKAELLTLHGYPADYLGPVYFCPDCKDTGYIGSTKCHCFEKEIVNYLYSQSNLKEILTHENFSHFDLSYYPDDYVEEATGQTPRDNMRNILNKVRDFLSHFDTDPANLLLYGNTGVGKTFLSNCIAKELLDTSHTVVYLTSLQLFDILETYKFDRELSYEEKDATISYILDSDLLILDDLGTELNNSFTSSQLYRCIDVRLNHRRSTVISTNLSFDDLREQYSERIFSRLTSNYSLLKLTGDDIRLQKALHKNGGKPK